MIALAAVLGFIVGGFCVAAVTLSPGDRPQWFTRGTDPHPKLDPWQPGALGVVVMARLEEAENSIFPPGMGVSYYDHVRDLVILLPIPLNLLVRYVRRFWAWMHRSDRGVWEVHVQLQARFHEGLERGRTEGVRSGLKEGIRVGRTEAWEQMSANLEQAIEEMRSRP